MYSNRRSFEILMLDLCLYDGVLDAPRSMYGDDERGEAEDRKTWGAVGAGSSLSNIEATEEDAEYVFDPSYENLLRKR